jgi:ADP-heptose:LPS heptosyltransferase
MVLAENRPILDILNLLPDGNILAVKNIGFSQTFSDLIKTLLRVRKLHVDTVVDMEFFSRSSAIIAYLCRAKKRIGNHRYNSEYSYRGDLFAHRVQYNPYIHLSLAYELLVETAKYNGSTAPLPKINTSDIQKYKPEFTSTPEEKKLIINMLAETSSQKYKKIIILNPNTTDIIPYRKWPSEYFLQLIELLIQKYRDALIVFTGLKSDYLSTEELCTKAKSNNVINLAGKLTLKELLVLYTISDILVTNDSGPGHFASLTDIDNIVLFGPETPILYGPTGDRTHILYAKLSCSPCVNVFNHRFSPCKDNVCMKEIRPQTVFEKIQEIFLEAK